MPSQKFASSGNSSFISDEKELQVVSVNWHFEQVVKLGSMPNNKNYVDNSEYEEIPTLWSAIQCEINYISVHSSPVSRTPELKRTQVLVLFVRLMSAPEQTRYLQPSLMSHRDDNGLWFVSELVQGKNYCCNFLQLTGLGHLSWLRWSGADLQPSLVTRSVPCPGVTVSVSQCKPDEELRFSNALWPTPAQPTFSRLKYSPRRSWSFVYRDLSLSLVKLEKKSGASWWGNTSSQTEGGGHYLWPGSVRAGDSGQGGQCVVVVVVFRLLGAEFSAGRISWLYLSYN